MRRQPLSIGTLRTPVWSVRPARMIIVLTTLLLQRNVRTTFVFGQEAMPAGMDTFLEFGDMSLMNNDASQAVQFYQQGVDIVEQKNKNNYYDYSLAVAISLYTNLGSAYSALENESNRLEKAATSYQNALLLYRQRISYITDSIMIEDSTLIASEASFYLGMAYQDLRQFEFAIAAYQYANELDPYHWKSIANIGSIRHDNQADYSGALDAYNTAYNMLVNKFIAHQITDPPLEPRFLLSQLQYRIGLCWSQLVHDPMKCKNIHNDGTIAVNDKDDTTSVVGGVNCKEMATHAYAVAVEYNPDNTSAQHMLASITADATIERAANEYVKSLFDEYAHNFEEALVNDLGYNGFYRLRNGMDTYFGDQTKVPTFDIVVDAGCGTGLVGEQFRDVASYLIGVDLSQVIINEAQKKRPYLYNETIVGDVTVIFRDRAPINLIVAGDSFIYFGDLDPLLESIRDGLADDGYVAFTLENVSLDNEEILDQTKPDWRWQLTASGRFAHRKKYVANTGNKFGLVLIHYESLDGFRSEHGIDVRGHLFVMQKKGNIIGQEL